MIEIPMEVLAQPEFRRALALSDWSTVLRLVIQQTGVSGAAIATATGLSQPHISRLLNGRVTEPGVRTIRMICDGLSIPRSLAGLLDRDQEPATNRRQLLEGALGVSGLALIGTADGDVPLEHAEDEQLLMIVSATQRRLEHRLPSRMLIGPAIAHLSLVRQLLRGRREPGGPGARPSTSGGYHRLATMASESAGLVAWLYTDLDDRANARRHYQLATREARKTGHPLLPSYMLGSFGHFAVTSGDPVQGLGLVAEARRNLPRSAPTIAHVWLSAIEAVALAHLKDQQAMTLLDSADRRLAKADNDDPVWPWLFRFDAPKLAGFRATAEVKLGRWQAAENSLRLSAGAQRSTKQQALADVERAYVLVAHHDVRSACAIAVAALDTGVRYGSERVLRTVADFRSRIGRAGNATAELDERLRGVYMDEP